MPQWAGLVPLVLWAGCQEPANPDEPEPTNEPDPDPDPEDTGVPVTPPADTDGDGFDTQIDCDDDDPDVFPGATERCDGVRSDCDGPGDDGLVTVDGEETLDDLSQALALAVEGSEIRVCRGTWVGPFATTVPIDLVGQGGYGAVTLTGGLSVPGGSSVTGVTVTGATGGDQGGIGVQTTGTFALTDSVVTANDGLQGGGVWLAPGVDATFPGSWIIGNEASEGGGLYVSAGSNVDLDGAMVTDNRALRGGGLVLQDAVLTSGLVTANEGVYGGGVFTRGTSAVTGTELVSNRASEEGGGAGISAEGGTLTLTDVHAHHNTAEVWGGGLFLQAADGVLLGTTRFEDNVGLEGAGVAVWDGTVTGGALRANTGTGLYLNDAVADGVLVHENEGVGINAFGASTIRGCTVQDNVADFTAGISFIASGSGRIEDTTVIRNRARYAYGGIDVYVASGTLVIASSTISDNSAPDAPGVSSRGAGRLSLESSTIVRNVGDQRGGGLTLEDTTQISVTDCDLGEGPDDNLPSDVQIGEHPVSGYGAHATFTCSNAGCDPLPGATP